jgi:alkaline phosphatase
LNYTTGIVTTTFVQDATICTPNTHVISRRSYDLIASQQLGYDHPLGQVIDVIIGGGRQYLHGNDTTYDGTKGLRADGVDYISKAVEDGWTYIGNRSAFDDLYESVAGTGQPQLPLLGLFDKNNLDYEIDRDADELPSLKENSLLALETLIKATEDTEQGFVLLLEGARIDHAGHAQDPATHARETKIYDETWKAVIDRVSKLDVETLVVSTSDHETGGYGLAIDNQYFYYPEVLVGTPHSAEYAVNILSEYEGEGEDKLNFIKTEVLGRALNINETSYTDEDVQALAVSKQVEVDLSELVSKIAGVGWTSLGHTAQDVPLYAYSNTKEGTNRIAAALGSSVENIEIPKFFAAELGVDLDEITELIKDIQVE